MEMMPYRANLDDAGRGAPWSWPPPTVRSPTTTALTTSDWQAGLPVLWGARVTLRELRLEDAASLFALLTTEEVTRFISPPPSSVEGFEGFIEWAHRRRAQGRCACFAVVPHGTDIAVGLFQIHLSDSDQRTADWGFALGSPYWGTGLFLDGARLVVTFAFEEIGLRRLEARATIQNGRGSGALRKVGAVRQGVLRRSFERAGQYLDQAVWTILREDWCGATTDIAPPWILGATRQTGRGPLGERYYAA